MAISNAQKSLLNGGINKLVGRADIATFDYPAGEFLKLFWTDDQIDMVKATQRLVHQYQIASMAPAIHRTVSIKHPAYPDHVAAYFAFDLMQPNNNIMLWPRDFIEFRDGADPNDILEFDALLQAIIRHETDIGLVREVLTFIVEACDSLEQMRYIFPPTLTLLRFAGITGHRLDTVRRPSKIPKMPYMMREKIRYAMDWFAIMELTDGFERTLAARTSSDIRVTFKGNHSIQCIDVGTGDSYEINVG